jgi:uncharacterized protein YbdZ (MbtH family)
MNGWVIAVDGSAVHLRHVTQVTAEKRAQHVDETWYVLARPAGICLATGLESREAAVAWIEQRFRPALPWYTAFSNAMDVPAGLKVDGTYAYDPHSR